MSHVTCPKCGSAEHFQGYGLAMGYMGAYTVCEGCDALLEGFADVEGLDDDLAKKQIAHVAGLLEQTWGPGSANNPEAKS